ncbi:hypothetical protein ACFLQ7_00395 [Actinomycetota bacterium]|jgi:drug/metabolite transporter superfamily protein YnfA
MSFSTDRPSSGAVMQLVGAAMIVVALIWLLAVDDPFPMWLIIAGAGLMFLGVGAAQRRSD